MTGTVLLALRLLMALLLYAFLGVALYLLWRDLQRHDDLLAARRAPPLTLLQMGGGQPAAHRFQRSEVLIGRSPACDLTLDHPTVSVRHARLRYHHAQWWVEDLGSTNGTYLNDEVVAEAVVLTGMDVLRCGSVALQVIESVGGGPAQEE